MKEARCVENVMRNRNILPAVNIANVRESVTDNPRNVVCSIAFAAIMFILLLFKAFLHFDICVHSYKVHYDKT